MTTKLRTQTAIVVMAAAIALGTTACFPDVSSRPKIAMLSWPRFEP